MQINIKISRRVTVQKHELTVKGSSISSLPALFTNMSPYSPMHQIATRTSVS